MWIRIKSNPMFYVINIQNVAQILWVSERDKSIAMVFPEKEIQQWIDLLAKISGLQLEAVQPFV